MRETHRSQVTVLVSQHAWCDTISHITPTHVVWYHILHSVQMCHYIIIIRVPCWEGSRTKVRSWSWSQHVCVMCMMRVLYHCTTLDEMFHKGGVPTNSKGDQRPRRCSCQCADSDVPCSHVPCCATAVGTSTCLRSVGLEGEHQTSLLIDANCANAANVLLCTALS